MEYICFLVIARNPSPSLIITNAPATPASQKCAISYIYPLDVEDIPYRHPAIPDILHQLSHRNNDWKSETFQNAFLLFQHPVALIGIIRIASEGYASESQTPGFATDSAR